MLSALPLGRSSRPGIVRKTGRNAILADYSCEHSPEHGTIATAGASVKLVATSYLTKPVDADPIVAAYIPDSTTVVPMTIARRLGGKPTSIRGPLI